MRSLLFVPADSARKLEKSLASGADALIIDLEDSVAFAAKPDARAKAAAFLEAVRPQPRRPRLIVRVNAFSSGFTDLDLAAVMPGKPDGIMLPKCSGAADVQRLAVKLAVHEAANEADDGTTGIIGIATETAASIFGLGTYAGASKRLEGLSWGAEDLSADLGAETNRLADGSYAAPYQLARALTLFAANAAGVTAIDSIYQNYRDSDGLRQECEAGRRDGFTAKMAIHPDQVAVVNAVFAPDPVALARAREIVALFAAQPEAGVIGYRGEMLDRPHLARAERLIARAEPDLSPGDQK